MLERGWLAAEQVLPGLRAEVVDHGAARFDSGRMPWLGEYGWLDDLVPGFDLVSVTRPLLELIIRRRIERFPRVALRSGELVRGLEQDRTGWTVLTDTGVHNAGLVVDASGRSSRLPTWLSDLGFDVPAPQVVDAHLGYATRLYAAPRPAAAAYRRRHRRYAGIRHWWARHAGGARAMAPDGRWLRGPPATPRSSGLPSFPRRAPGSGARRDRRTARTDHRGSRSSPDRQPPLSLRNHARLANGTAGGWRRGRRVQSGLRTGHQRRRQPGRSAAGGATSRCGAGASPAAGPVRGSRSAVVHRHQRGPPSSQRPAHSRPSGAVVRDVGRAPGATRRVGRSRGNRGLRADLQHDRAHPRCCSIRCWSAECCAPSSFRRDRCRGPRFSTP